MEAASSWIESGSLNLNLRTRPNPITQISKIAFCSSFRNVKERKKKKHTKWKSSWDLYKKTSS